MRRIPRPLEVSESMSACVVAVHAKPVHAFSKETVAAIELIAGQGVAGDAHCGVTVKHRSRVSRDPTQPNLRQVHLMHSELFAELAENITTAGLPLLELSEGSVIRIGSQATVRITGLRNPCSQIEAFLPGLLAAVLDRDANGDLVRKAGIMGVVLESGSVRPGDAITLVHVPVPHVPLRPV